MEKRYGYITPQDYETAEKSGITRHALEQRVRDYGWDIDRAITQPLKIQVPFQPIWDEWQDVATKNGISKKLFYHRVKKNGWSKEMSATHPIMKGKPLSDDWTDEERETARRNGLDKNYMNAVKVRIRNGWTREEALNTPRLTVDERLERVRAGVKNRRVNREFNKTK